MRTKAFTLIELIFVIVLIGILAVSATSRFTNDTLQNAADQVINHIRYTQHLAMMDSKYKPMPDGEYSNTTQDTKSAQYWYRGWWRIMFSSQSNRWSYSIFTDKPTTSNDVNYDRQPNRTTGEFAIDPHTGNFMSGGYNTTLPVGDSQAIDAMVLNSEYGITTVTVTGTGCGQTIAFDSFGRPHRILNSTSRAHDDMITNTCTIILTHRDGSTINVFVEPYTGYAHL